MNAMPAFSSRFGSGGSRVRTSIEGWLAARRSRAGDTPASSSAAEIRPRDDRILHDLGELVGTSFDPEQRRGRPGARRRRLRRAAATAAASLVAERHRRRPRRPARSAASPMSARTDRLASCRRGPARTRASSSPPKAPEQDEQRQSTMSVIAVEMTNPLSRRRTREVPGGNQAPCASVGRRGDAIAARSCADHFAEQLRERSGAPGRSARRRRRPAQGRAAVARRRRRASSKTRPSRRRFRRDRRRGSTRASRRRRSALRPRRVAAPGVARSSSIVPWATIRPPSISTTASQSRSTRSS